MENGLSQLLKKLSGFKSKEVKVGIMKGKQSRRRTRNGEQPSDVPLAYIAALHEYGTTNMPQRAFMRGALEKHQDELKQAKADCIKSVIQGECSVEQALDKLGALVQSWIEAEIDSGDFAPLAPATVARKGHSQPLVDTGTLRNSIEHKLVSKGE